MGCASSSALPKEEESFREEVNDEPPPTAYVQAEQVSASLERRARERLIKLKELDQATKVPFILVELTGEDNEEGEIEVCGKDEYGVYAALDDFFINKWECSKLDPGDIENEDSKIPFCSAQYRWPGFKREGEEGLNNMGFKTMRLIDFMCGTLSWTLAVVNGGNIGQKGDIRETQIVFKAPHPMNLTTPHLMIELRSAGFIEVCADLEEEHMDILTNLDSYFYSRFQAEILEGHETFCDRYYKAGDGVFRGEAGTLESNFGLLSTEVADKVVSYDGWSLVACNGGNYGETGEHSEVQFVFRRDYHPLCDMKDTSYIQMIINGSAESGNIEVNGQKQKEEQYSRIHKELNTYLTNRMRCSQAGELWEGRDEVIAAAEAGEETDRIEMMCRRYAWGVRNPDILRAVADVTKFFENKGWELQLASQAMVKEEGTQCRETQLFFRPGKTEVGTIEPHLFLELYAGEGKEELYEDEEQTQVLANQRIRWRSIGPPRGKEKEVLQQAEAALEDFFRQYLEAERKDSGPAGEIEYECNVFLCRGRFENNLAQWTMRICDYMVDRLGWNFINCSLCNMGDQGQYRLQQLVFHWDGEKPEIPVSLANDFSNQNAAEWAGTAMPDYWSDEVLNSQMVHKVVALKGHSEEHQALQEILDATFKRVLTRDRKPDDEAPDEEEMPYKLDIVQVFRSEHACLHHRLTQKRAPFERSGSFALKTSAAGSHINDRLEGGEGYLFHGTNPSSALSILRTGFVLDHAGATTGMMYGAGIYCAECSSKADEYSRDAGGNTYPSLHAILVNRCFVGTPLVVDGAGPHTETARETGLHCVCGDREGKVGTYREFIFYDEHQVYPEYAVIYRRVYDPRRVPAEMRVPTKGTTGRFWQLKAKSGRDGWTNLPTEINKQLLEASVAGEESLDLNWRGTEYTFFIQEKRAVNKRTGNEVGLRAPMHLK